MRETGDDGGVLVVGADRQSVTEPSIRGERVRLLALLVVGLLVPGLLRWWLGTLGYDLVGIAVFVAGYGLTCLLVWRRWLRGVAFVGPDG